MNQPQLRLKQNLAAIRRHHPDLARELALVEPRSLGVTASKQGPVTAVVDFDGKSIQLASRFDPVAEARKLASTISTSEKALVVVTGFGLGYHIRAVLDDLGSQSRCLVYEPDEKLFRAVLEIADLRSLLEDQRLMLMVGRTDRGRVIKRLDGLSFLALQGTGVLSFPPGRVMHEKQFSDFGTWITDFLGFARTQVSTMIVNATRTVANYLGNLDFYAAGATTDPLRNAAKGYPAVCVSAGPSLARNVQLLADPEWRRRVVVISTQTTLKYLLARGITPDFITALDYSAVSARFYEDLPELEHCTLVAEPMVSDAVPSAYPGPVRMTQSSFLDALLGDRRCEHPIPYGATVAHLSFYLAQHLGCDPIMFLGQDLGFSDNLYYCPGTPLHDVWMPEINPFNTLEMMEWRRVVGCRPHLHRAVDQHGLPIYLDEQMATYLKQFERDFAEAPQEVLDCSEGGMVKKNARIMSFEEALKTYARSPIIPLPIAPKSLQAERVSEARKMFRLRREELGELRQLSRETLDLLEKMTECLDNIPAFNRLAEKIDRKRERVMKMEHAFMLIEEFNAIGLFHRAKADRNLAETGKDNTDLEYRRQQVDRDQANVRWIMEACDEAIRLFDEARQRWRPISAAKTPGPGPAPAAA